MPLCRAAEAAFASWGRAAAAAAPLRSQCSPWRAAIIAAVKDLLLGLGDALCPEVNPRSPLFGTGGGGSLFGEIGRAHV